MKNTQNAAIVMLLVVAAILGAVLVGMYTSNDTAYAGTTATSGGDYAMTTGAFSSDIELVYIVDMAAEQLNVYVLNPNNRSLELKDTADLSTAFR